MATAAANGIRIEYDTFGNPQSPALLLIMGLATQMIYWEEEFCQSLADNGLYVIRFDNRDIGMSTILHDLGKPDIMGTIVSLMEGKPVQPLYSLHDMAADTVGLLDALQIEKAHICGLSMGGMIAQTFCLQYPQRALSLTSIMSTTGNPELPQAKPETMKVLLQPTPTERQAYIESEVEVWKTIGSPGFPFDEPKIRKFSAESFNRGIDPAGIMRQLLAILTQENRKPLLAKLSLPTLVIHGKGDPLLPVACGIDTAEAIPGAELALYEGMGHDLPPDLWSEIVTKIVSLTKKVQ